MLRVEPKDNGSDVMMISFLIERENPWEVSSGGEVRRGLSPKQLVETLGTFLASFPSVPVVSASFPLDRYVSLSYLGVRYICGGCTNSDLHEYLVAGGRSLSLPRAHAATAKRTAGGL